MQSDSIASVREVIGLANRGQIKEACSIADKLSLPAARAVARGYALFRDGDIINGTLCLRAAVQAKPDITLADLLIKLLIQFELHFPLYHLLNDLAKRQSSLSNEQLYHLVLSSQATGNMADSYNWLNKLKEQASQARGLDLLEGHFAKSFADTEKAQESYHQFIRECPQATGTGLWSLCDLKGYQFSSADKALAESAKPVTSDKLQAGLIDLALSKMQADNKDYQESMMSLVAGNNQLSRVRPFQHQAFKQLVNALSSQDFHNSPDNKHGKNIIFVCGLPRSGTTLIEQILANAPIVETTNELPFMERIALYLQIKGHNPTQPLSEPIKQRLRTFYLDQIQDFATQPGGILIDKNPNNFIHHHLITELFPAAKVINVLRPVKDNSIALYRQFFMTGNEYAYRIEDILTYIEGYYSLLQHSQRQNVAPIIIDYEALVSAPETEVENLYRLCDLPFSENALNFHQQTTPVLTPSASQVRKPINRASLGSGEPFSALLEPYQQRIDALIKQRREILDAITM